MSRAGIDPDRVARILVDASLSGDDAAAAQHGISLRTIANYRNRLATDPALAASVHQKRTLIDAEWAERTRAETDAALRAPTAPANADETLKEFITRTAPKHSNPIPWHLVRLIDLFERAMREQVYAIVSMPPRHAKTTTLRRAMAYAVMKHTDRLNGIASYAGPAAAHQSRQIRDIVKAEGMKLHPSAQSLGMWLTMQEGGLFAAGINGQWTGKGIGGVLGADDILKGREQAESVVVRDKLWSTVTDDIISRLEPPVGSILFVNTRWHEDDVSGRLLERSGKDGFPTFELINMPALRDPVTGEPSDADDAIALWPDRFPVEKLRTIRAILGPYAWASLYQGRPTPADGAIFLREWLQKTWVTLPPGGQWLQSWDMAFSLLAQSTDNVVGQVWYQHGTDFYLVDQVCKRMNFSETLDAVRALSKKWPQAHKKLVEAKANGPAVVQSLRRELTGLTLVAPDENGTKVGRARAVEGLFSGGNVILPHPMLAQVGLYCVRAANDNSVGAPWVVTTYIPELLSFPNAPHDDQVDATTQALNHLAQGYGARLKAAMGVVFKPTEPEVVKAPEPEPEPAPVIDPPTKSATPADKLNDAVGRLRAMLKKSA